MSCETSPSAPTAPATVGSPSLPQTFTKTIVADATEEALTADVTFANWFRLHAIKGANPATGISGNDSPVYWGWKTLVTPNVLQPGAVQDFQTPYGQKFDLSQIIVYGDQDDAIVVEYS